MAYSAYILKMKLREIANTVNELSNARIEKYRTITFWMVINDQKRKKELDNYVSIIENNTGERLESIDHSEIRNLLYKTLNDDK